MSTTSAILKSLKSKPRMKMATMLTPMFNTKKKTRLRLSLATAVKRAGRMTLRTSGSKTS